MSYEVRLADNGTGASPDGLALERLGAMAKQVAACTAECESFLAEQMAAWERLERQIGGYLANMRSILGGAPEKRGEVNGEARPHSDDPVVAAVLADLAALRRAE